MPISTPTTKATLPSNCRAQSRTDLRWNRAANPHPRRTRSSRRPHEAKSTNTRRQWGTVSAGSTQFPPLPPSSRVCPLMRLLTVAFDRGFARDRRKHEVACPSNSRCRRHRSSGAPQREAVIASAAKPLPRDGLMLYVLLSSKRFAIRLICSLECDCISEMARWYSLFPSITNSALQHSR